MRPSSSASSSSFVNSPLPPIFARGTSRILSPVVLIGMSSTVNPCHLCSSARLVQFACHSAKALLRVPSLRLAIFAGAVYDRPLLLAFAEKGGHRLPLQ